MQSDPLSPGDCVVPLAGLSTQCSTIAGALSLGCVLFQASAPGIWIVGGILIGAAVGFATGGLFARVFYPATQDQVVVVRAGRSALASTLPAAFVPSAVCSFALTIATSAILDAPTFSMAVIIAAIASLSVACIFGFGSALA